ncbi:MAG: Na+/H+ antiporter [Gemmatimonadales bacterium]
MTTAILVLALLLAVVVSGILARILPVGIPRPLVQIAFGAAIGLVAHFRVALDPELFFLLFLPPLLFLDGWRIPNDELLDDGRTIAGLALGLVAFTVLGAGLLIHAMIPAMPLAVAFALAAVISPTDPIAVSGIAARVPVPNRMMRILEGESLLNDASGLVCLRFAVAAALTGVFSPVDAGVTFLWLAIGGVGIGVAIAWGIDRAQTWASAQIGEDTGILTIASLLTPFAAYLAAEELHCSGILAAVAAGVALSAAETSGRSLAATRLRRRAVWDTVQFALNGIIFVLLGEQLPEILSDSVATVAVTGHRSPWWLAVYVLGITLALGLLRFLWVWVTLRVTLRYTRRWRRSTTRPNRRLIAAFSVAGVRGAVTLAGALTLPLTLGDGSPFPARSLAIFLAAGVIIASLLAASAALPLLLRGIEMPPESPRQAEADRARVASAEAAITAVKRAIAAVPPRSEDAAVSLSAATQVLEFYRAQIELRTGDEAGAAGSSQTRRVTRELRLIAIQAERDEIFRLIRERKVSSGAGEKLVRELDLRDAWLRT